MHDLADPNKTFPWFEAVERYQRHGKREMLTKTQCMWEIWMEAELLCEWKMKLLPSADIGLVPEGRRVNFPFTGEVSGPKIRGKLDGVDYVLVRPDGIGLLHVHGVINTNGGDRISIEVSGFATPTKEEGQRVLREVVTFRTGSKEFAWLNSTQGVGEGYADMKMREITLRFYTI